MNQQLRWTSIFTLIIFCFFSTQAWAGTIMKVKGDRAQVRIDEGEFLKGDLVRIYDGLGGNAGRAKVYKVRGTRAYIKKLEGTVRRGYTVRINRSDSKVSATGSSIQGFFGLAFIDQLDDKPFVFAGDYKFQLSNISWLSGLDLKAGLLYWGQSVAFGDFSILELSGAVEKKLTTLSQIDIYAGGRFGYARSEYTVSILGTSVSDSGGDLFIAPYVGASYPINAQFSAGAELRIPYYLDDNYDFFDVVYLLAMVEYRL